MTHAPLLPTVFLRPRCDGRIAAGHPWAYSNEIRMDADAKALPPGTVVGLCRTDGKPLGVGTFNPHALIAFRLISGDPRAGIDAAFFVDHLRRALALRERLFAAPFYRLVHAEADGLPGLIIDRFDEVVVVQANTAGMDRLVPTLAGALEEVLQPRAIVLRNDSRARAAEGLPMEVVVHSGTVPGPVAGREDGLAFRADLLAGQKTGWFFDQRAERAFVAALAAGARVLDLFCHSGGFGIAAARHGAASVLGIDSSAPALALAETMAADNGVGARCAFRAGDAFDQLERLATADERFDIVIADPPAFVRSRKDLKVGLRGYRKLARLSAALVAPGGFLFMASCSHNVGIQPFTEEVARGMAAAGRGGRIIRAGGAGPDHPVHPRLHETAYLNTLTLHLD